MSFLLVLVALAGSAAAYLSSSPGSQALPDSPQPQPELIIHFPRTSEIACWLGARPPAGSRGVFFQLERVLGADHTCRFLAYNMRDYRGSTDAYRFRRLVSMFPDIVRPDRRLQCDASSDDLWDPEDLQSGDFEVVRGDGQRRLCRMVADAEGRDVELGRLQLREGYKRLPGGVLLLRSWYHMPPPEGSSGSGRYARSPQPSRAHHAR